MAEQDKPQTEAGQSGNKRSASTALLVIDMQKDFMNAKGACAKMGFPDCGSPVVPAISKLLDAARSSGVRVFWIRADYSPSVTGSAFAKKMEAFPEPVCTTDWGREITDKLKVKKGDVEVVKTCYSAFHDTNLAAILRKHGVDSVVCTGIMSTVCVESTAREAFFEGFHTMIAADAVGDAPEATAAFLKRFATFFGSVVNTDKICGQWQKQESKEPTETDNKDFLESKEEAADTTEKATKKAGPRDPENQPDAAPAAAAEPAAAEPAAAEPAAAEAPAAEELTLE